MKLRDRTPQNWTVSILATLITACFLTLIIFSPMMMRAVLSQTLEWQTLSDVGQAYGGISAILAGLAFLGIAGSLLLQWRQNRLTQITASRERHFELVRMAMEDPRLTFPAMRDKDDPTHRRMMYLNLWFSHWAMLWDIGVIGQAGLRANFKQLFDDDIGREWWTELGSVWDPAPTKHRKEFLNTADEAYRAAMADRGASPE